MVYKENAAGMYYYIVIGLYLQAPCSVDKYIRVWFSCVILLRMRREQKCPSVSVCSVFSELGEHSFPLAFVLHLFETGETYDYH